MAFFNLPDEIILQILGELQTEPDILLNIAPLVCKQFRRLSYDSSLWKTFSVPGHWSHDTTLRFLQLHPAGTCVQYLTCPSGFVHHLVDLALACDSLCIPNVVRLLVTLGDERNFTSLQKHDCLKHLPDLFPNLTCLRTSEATPHTYEQLHRLTTSLPDVKLELGAISSSAVLLMPAVCKENLKLTSAESLEGFSQNLELFDVSNINLYLDISARNEMDNFSKIELNLRHFGHCVRELQLDCFIHFHELHTITIVCRSLGKLHLDCVAGCEELWDLEDMTCLRDLYLRIAGFAFDDLEVSDEDTMKIINSCPSLETLAVGIPNNVSESILWSLPLSLSSLEFLHRTSNPVSQRNFIASILRAVHNNCIRLKSITGNGCVVSVISEMLDEDEETRFLNDLEDLHLTSSGVPEFHRESIPNILQRFIDRQIPMKTLHVNKFSLSHNIFHVIIGCSDLRDLRLEGNFNFSALSKDLVILAENLSYLERLKINMIKQELVLNQKWNLDILISRLDPLTTALKQFKRLTFFLLDGLVLDYSSTLQRAAQLKKAEQRLNTHYGPWSNFILGRNSFRFTQCPPVHRSFLDHESCNSI